MPFLTRVPDGVTASFASAPNVVSQNVIMANYGASQVRAVRVGARARALGQSGFVGCAPHASGADVSSEAVPGMCR